MQDCERGEDGGVSINRGYHIYLRAPPDKDLCVRVSFVFVSEMCVCVCLRDMHVCVHVWVCVLKSMVIP